MNYNNFVYNWWDRCECLMVVWKLKEWPFLYELSCIFNFVKMLLYSFISAIFQDNLLFIGLFVNNRIGCELMGFVNLFMTWFSFLFVKVCLGGWLLLYCQTQISEKKISSIFLNCYVMLNWSYFIYQVRLKFY